MCFRKTNQNVAYLVRRGCIGAMFEVILWKKIHINIHGLSILPAFLRLSTFRKYESSTAEKLVLQENAHGDRAIYYSESIGTELVVCTLHAVWEMAWEFTAIFDRFPPLSEST